MSLVKKKSAILYGDATFCIFCCVIINIVIFLFNSVIYLLNISNKLGAFVYHDRSIETGFGGCKVGFVKSIQCKSTLKSRHELHWCISSRFSANNICSYFFSQGVLSQRFIDKTRTHHLGLLFLVLTSKQLNVSAYLSGLKLTWCAFKSKSSIPWQSKVLSLLLFLPEVKIDIFLLA